MQTLRWVGVAIVAALVVAVLEGRAEAQSVTVQGQVQYQPYGQPPPGYGQPTYGQPVYQQPVQPYYGQPVYQQPQRQVRYVEQSSSIAALWIPGIVVFGVSYVLTASFAQLSPDIDYALYGYIPLAGPWLMLSEANNDDEVMGALLGGIGQVAGLTMFVLGLALQRTERVAVYSFNERDPRSPTLAFDVTPTAGSGALASLTLSHF